MDFRPESLRAAYCCSGSTRGSSSIAWCPLGLFGCELSTTSCDYFQYLAQDHESLKLSTPPQWMLALDPKELPRAKTMRSIGGVQSCPWQPLPQCDQSTCMCSDHIERRRHLSCSSSVHSFTYLLSSSACRLGRHAGWHGRWVVQVVLRGGTCACFGGMGQAWGAA